MQTVVAAAETVTYLPYESIAITVSVLLVVFGAIITVDKVIDVIKKWRKPKANEQESLKMQQMECKRHFESDLARIKALETASVKQQEMDRVMLTALRAILSHEINGNSIERMQEANAAIDQMLINR